MKSFASLRQKRGGEDDKKIYHGSPSKKKAVVNYVKVIQMNPYTLGAYFIKEDGTSAFYWPLITGLENKESWCKELQIGMTVRRRAVGGAPSEVMKVKTKRGEINWHIFLRFLDKDEIKESKKIAQSWGKNLAGTMSKYFYSRRKEANVNTTFLAERFVFNNVTNAVENLSDHVVQNDIVGVAKVLFQESVASKEFFKDNELLKLLFPDAAHVEKLFEYYM